MAQPCLPVGTIGSSSCTQCEHSSVRPAAKPDAAGVPVCGLLLRRRLEARVVGLGLLREHELIDGDCTEVNYSA